MKVYLRTFGCRANQYDSERVRAMVQAAGGTIVAEPRDADVAVFNSCAVTAAAEADLRQGVRRAAREQPALRSVVMGCAAALDAKPRGARTAPLSALPSVDVVVAGADLPAVAAALGLERAERLDAVPTRGQSGARALLRVQDGCDEHCTFCATTIARGAHRSRAIDALVAEATALAAHHPEIVLTGVHIGSYGLDTGGSLGGLVRRLVRDVPHVRFRLTSVEATEVDPELRELLTSEPARVAPYLHAPLQSGSDAVLRRMGRHWYRAAGYARAIERLVRDTPVFGLGADVIAGFPGETAADHCATVDLVERLPFTSLHVFPWSPRPGTAAERLPDRVAPSQIAERAAELREVSARKAAEYRAARVGGIADVVVVTGAPRREGITGDHLTVRAADVSLPRGSRFLATLGAGVPHLVARPFVSAA